MTTRKITTPDAEFSGTRAGVVFRDGRGEVDADDAGALAYFARHGYPVDTPSPARRGRPTAKPGERAAKADQPPVEADPEPED